MKTNVLLKKRIKSSLFPFLALTFVSLLLASCGGNSSQASESTASSDESQQTEAAATIDTKAPSDSKGIGKFTDVKIDGLNAEHATKGKTVFESKCSACHRMDETKIVGPGLKGVTKRRTPEWIMNMITNPAEMTQKDPVAKALLEEHLTQMTFQNVSDDETRHILEFFRQNDSVN